MAILVVLATQRSCGTDLGVAARASVAWFNIIRRIGVTTSDPITGRQHSGKRCHSTMPYAMMLER